MRQTERELTTPLFLLRCMEVGISIPDLDLLTIGLVMDIWTEKGNDVINYAYKAQQSDYDFNHNIPTAAMALAGISL